MKGSTAYTLWENMQKDPKGKAKLDEHLKDLDKKNKDLTK